MSFMCHNKRRSHPIELTEADKRQILAMVEESMRPIPEDLPDEIRIVLLCRAIRRIQKRRGRSFGDEADLTNLEHQLDKELAKYDSDTALRNIKT